MKKALHLILPAIIFFGALLYLHQKVRIYVEAYRLSGNYYRHNELLDKRDYLVYNFSQEVSLAKVNQWAQVQKFTFVDKAKVLALGGKEQKQASGSKIALLFSRLLKASASASTALAKE